MAPRIIKVVPAVQRDLKKLAERDPDLARSSLAASALALAREMDNPKNSATSKSMCARSLIETLDRLEEAAPDEQQEASPLDELKARRAARRAAAASG